MLPREPAVVTVHRRPRLGWRRGSPWVAAGLVLLVLVASGGARGVPFPTFSTWVGHARPLVGPANETIYLNLTDAPSFVPRFISAAPGQNVSIHLNNSGTIPHSFTLESVSGVAVNRSLSPAELNASLVAHPPTVNVSVAPGTDVDWANFTVATNASFDSFLFLSQVPYQYQAGMWGYLNITSSTPGLALSDNTTNALAFQPAALAADPAHFPANFEIDVVNLGDIAHTFTLAAQPNVTLSTIGYFHTNAPAVNVTVALTVGKGAYGNFTLKTPGVYEFVCTEPGHFAAGMYGFLYAGVPVPAAAPPLSTAIVQTWVLAGSAALIGIGVLLVVVAGFTGRFPPAPPGAHGGH